MTLFDQSVPNLLGGVSQQAENLRFPNQAKESINTHASTVEGLIKRNPSKFIADVGSAGDSQRLHIIDRSPSERYALVVNDDKTISAYDLLTGSPVEMQDENGDAYSNYAYLQTATSADKIKFFTAGDYTFAVNTEEIVQPATDLTQEYNNGALVTIVSGDYGSKYDIILDNTTYSLSDQSAVGGDNYGGETPNGSSAAHRPLIGTDRIAKNLQQTISGQGGNSSLIRVGSAPNPLEKIIYRPGATAGTFRLEIRYRFRLRKYVTRRLRKTTKWYDRKERFTLYFDYNASAADFQNNLNVNRDSFVVDGGWSRYLQNVFSTDPDDFKPYDGNYKGRPTVVGVTGSSIGTDVANAITVDFAELLDNTVWETTLPAASKGEFVGTWEFFEFDHDSFELVVVDDTTTGTSTSADFVVDRFGSTLWIRRPDGEDFTIDVEDSFGGDSMNLVKGSVQTFADLPKEAPNDFRIKVSGDPDTDVDEYYLRFEVDNTGEAMGTGLWNEDVGPNVQYRWDESTLPLRFASIVDEEGNAYFKVSVMPLESRAAGDDTSNPFPSFVDSPIAFVTYHRGRLVVGSSESVALSEADNVNNFFRTTVVDLLDTDRIDMTATTDKVSLLRSAVLTSQDCIIFSNQTQFRIDSAGDLLTPKTAALMNVGNFKSAIECDPVALGDSMYFAFNRVDYAGVNEMRNESGGQQPLYAAFEVSEQVPKYMAGDATRMTATSIENMLAVQTDGFDGLYMYKFADQGRERVQSAWSKYEPGGGGVVIDMEFADTSLYMIVERGGRNVIEVAQFQDGQADAGEQFVYRLDCRVDDEACTTTYYSATNKTEVVLPYQAGSDLILIERTAAGQKAGALHTPSYVEGSAIVTVPGDQSAKKFYVGHKYNMRHDLGAFYMRGRSRNGDSAMVSGRMQVRYIDLLFDDTLFFKVTVTPKYRDSWTVKYSGFNVESGSATIGALSQEDDRLRVPVMAKNTEYDFVIENDTAMPCSFSAAEIRMRYDSKGRRIG